MMESNADHHSGFSGSMKDYAAGKFDTRNTSSSSKKASHKASAPAAQSSSKSSKSHSGYSGSVDSYLDKYK